MMKCHAVSDKTQTVGLSVLPFFHIYGFNAILNSTFLHGLHMVSLLKFTPEDYIRCVVKFKVMVKQVITFFSSANNFYFF
jgi:acyl-CoA synthetase (AMP-forming)/AMP-acid ligase II